MFDVAPTELLLLGIVALLVIGPKDLPKAMRFVGKWVARARGMARHFRDGMDEMIRHAELEEMEKKWRTENERIMREHPPEPAPDQHAMTPLPAPAGQSTPEDEEDGISPAVLATPSTPHPPAADPEGQPIPSAPPSHGAAPAPPVPEAVPDGAQPRDDRAAN